MAQTATTTETRTGIELTDWQAGTVAGILGGIAMGVMLTMQMTPVIEHAIPALYGLDGGLAGWVIHVSHAAVLGVAFVAIASAVLDADATLGKTTALGVGYGVLAWVVLAALVMPVWLDAVGFANAPGVPNLNPQSLVGHVVYGVVLGGAYAVID